jgi:hypothetical protein
MNSKMNRQDNAEPREDTRQAATRPTAGDVHNVTVIRTEFKIGHEDVPQKENKK